MRSKLTVAIGFLSLLAMVFPKNVVAAQNEVAIVVDARGDVKVTSPGQQPQNLTVGMNVSEGDSIATGSQSYLKLIRTDSSIIKLN
jgi:hypothetical protein